MPPHSPVSSRIALVEDHARLAVLIERGLAQAGLAVDVLPTLQSAWHALCAQAYALAIVDRGLPDGDGLELVRRLRAAGNPMPCLMLTSCDALRDRIDGLDAGADDYLAKPFALDELAARVRALLRRPSALRSLALVFEGLELVPEQGRMQCGEDSVSLAPAELQIMVCLMRAAGRTVRRSTLEAAAWGIDAAVTPNALDVALHRLRKKIAAVGAPVALVNVRHQGYSLRSDSAAA